MVKKRKNIHLEQKMALMTREQLILSKERTILSFMRTGLAFIGAGVVVLNLFKDNYPSCVIGWMLVLIGFVEILESYRRLRVYKKKMEKIKNVLGDV